VQWITSDNDGKIWFAAQRGSALGSITTTTKSGSPVSVNDEEQEQQQQLMLPNGTSGPATPIEQLGFSFADIAGPAIAAGIVISALAYVKSATDLKRNIRTVLKLER
jgi:hypothetical protein